VESGHAPSRDTLPPSAGNPRSLEGQAEIYCGSIWLLRNELLSAVGAERGDRQPRAMESIDLRNCACPALVCLEEAELFMF